MEAQALAEQKLEEDTESRTQYRVEFECSPPQPCSEFQTARLILSHLGFLSVPALRSHAVDSPVPSLVALDNDEPAFAAELAALDRLPLRTHDTLLAFYVRAGQSAPESIVANSKAADLSPLYLELLAALSWPVQVATHPGWTGDPSTSWGLSQDHAGQNQRNPGPARFDGTESVLYWADAHTSYLSFFLHQHILRPENFTLKVRKFPTKKASRQNSVNLWHKLPRDKIA